MRPIGVASLIALMLLWIHGRTSWVVLALIAASLGLSRRRAGACAVVAAQRREGDSALAARDPGGARAVRDDQGGAGAAGAQRAPDRQADPAQLRRLRARRADDAAVPASRWASTRSFSAAFSAFILASIVVTLGPIPMGLGSFEAVSIGMLARGRRAVRGGAVGDVAVPRLHFVGAAAPRHGRGAAAAEAEEKS